MKLEHFQADNQATWDELERLMQRAGTRPSALPAGDILALGRLYRRTSADLAQARQRYPHDPLVQRLEYLIRRSRPLVYGRSATDGAVTFKSFFATDYWRTITERPQLLALATALLVVPAIAGAVLGVSDPATTAGLVPEGFLWVTEAQGAGTDIGADASGLAAFSTAVLINNIQVTVLAFALGITFGLGTALVTAYNGFILGAVIGLGADAGNSALLVEAVAAHGILELSCIVAAAVAGLRMASALVAPGLRPRPVALREESVAAVKIVIGTAPWLIVAGFVEGFVSRSGTSAGPAVLIGIVIGGAFWWLVAARGLDQNRTSDLAFR